MNPTTVKLLHAASQMLGGEALLARHLGVEAALLSKYMIGARKLPDPLLLRAVDLLLEGREGREGPGLAPPGDREERELVAPSSSLHERLVTRIGGAGETVAAEPRPWSEPPWEDIAPGTARKLLTADSSHWASMLLRLAPGAVYLRSADRAEEMHVLSGELLVSGRTLRAGDYDRCIPGPGGLRMSSATGCICIILAEIVTKPGQL